MSFSALPWLATWSVLGWLLLLVRIIRRSLAIALLIHPVRLLLLLLLAPRLSAATAAAAAAIS
jgi:hypothetical protein